MHVETYNRLSVYWDVTPLTLMSKIQYVSSALRTSNFTNIVYHLFYLIVPFTLVNVICSSFLLPYTQLDSLDEELGRVMAQAVSRRLVPLDVRFQTQTSPCGICGRKSGIDISTLVFPASVIPPAIYLSPLPYHYSS